MKQVKKPSGGPDGGAAASPPGMKSPPSGKKSRFDPKKWEKIRAKGRNRYILVRGVLMMGTAFAVVAALLEPVIGRMAWGEAYAPDPWVRYVQWPVAGICFGLLMGIMTWYGGERQYEAAGGGRPTRSATAWGRRRKRK